MSPDVPDVPPIFRPGVRLSARYLVSSTLTFCRLTQLELTPALVLLGLLCSNVSDGRRAGLGRPASGLAPLAPSSIYAVARRTKLPYETARRQIPDLQARGFCVPAGRGLLVPPEMLSSPIFRAYREAVWSAVWQLHATLGELGHAAPPLSADPTAATLTRVSRLNVPLLIDGLRLVADALGVGLAPTLLFLAVNQSNTEDLATDLSLARGLAAPDALREDAHRRPVTVYALSKALRVPYETARRHTHKLIDSGHCQTDAQGRLIVPAAVLTQPSLMMAAAQSWGLAQLFLAEVSEVDASAA